MNDKTIWVRGRPVRGTIFGLVTGLGLFLLLTKFELIVIDTGTFLITVLGGGVVGLVRALIGRPYRAAFEAPAPDQPVGEPSS